jgi:hypothetical protein
VAASGDKLLWDLATADRFGLMHATTRVCIRNHASLSPTLYAHTDYTTGSSEKVYLRNHFLFTIVRSMVICVISLAEIPGSVLILQSGNNENTRRSPKWQNRVVRVNLNTLLLSSLADYCRNCQLLSQHYFFLSGEPESRLSGDTLRDYCRAERFARSAQ